MLVINNKYTHYLLDLQLIGKSRVTFNFDNSIMLNSQ